MISLFQLFLLTGFQVKPNLGHSEAASGITSIVKAVLSLETKTIIPNIKFENPSVSSKSLLPPLPLFMTSSYSSNPVPFASAGLRVPTEPLPWPEDRAERIGINSFGIGGTNVHVSAVQPLLFHGHMTHGI